MTTRSALQQTRNNRSFLCVDTFLPPSLACTLLVSQSTIAATNKPYARAGAVDLRNALANHFGVELPATVVYDYPTPAALAAHIAKLLAAQQPAQAAGTHDVVAAKTNQPGSFSCPLYIYSGATWAQKSGCRAGTTAVSSEPEAAPQRAIVAASNRNREGGSFTSEVVGVACRFPGNVTGTVLNVWHDDVCYYFPLSMTPLSF